MQTELIYQEKQVKPHLTKDYSKGTYNKMDHKEQWIRISEGCPNNCGFCRETLENGSKPIYYDIPKIERNIVKITDMNLIYKKDVLKILRYLKHQKVDNKVVYYELVCGVDYRFLNYEIAKALKQARFKNIRLAWDHSINQQKRIKKSIETLRSVGYNNNDIMVFMICNWNVSYFDNLFKLDLCKIWNVKVGDCWFDNQLAPNIKPIHWDIDQIKDFRMRVRKHNQMVNFGIDPEM